MALEDMTSPQEAHVVEPVVVSGDATVSESMTNPENGSISPAGSIIHRPELRLASEKLASLQQTAGEADKQSDANYELCQCSRSESPNRSRESSQEAPVGRSRRKLRSSSSLEKFPPRSHDPTQMSILSPISERAESLSDVRSNTPQHRASSNTGNQYRVLTGDELQALLRKLQGHNVRSATVANDKSPSEHPASDRRRKGSPERSCRTSPSISKDEKKRSIHREQKKRGSSKKSPKGSQRTPKRSATARWVDEHAIDMNDPLNRHFHPKYYPFRSHHDPDGFLTQPKSSYAYVGKADAKAKVVGAIIRVAGTVLREPELRVCCST